MNELSKKRILISAEQQNAQVGSFFREMGLELDSEYDKEQEANYLFILNDHLEELKILPRIQTKKTIPIDCQSEVRGFFDESLIHEKDARNLLDSYFNQSQGFDLVDQFSKDFQKVFTLKVQDYLNIGYFIDTIVVEAYKNKFDYDNIRNYLDFAIRYSLKLVEQEEKQPPLEITFAHNSTGFVVQISLSAPNLDMNTGFNLKSENMKSFSEKSNYFDASFNKKREKLLLSSLWFKEKNLQTFRSFFFTEISERKAISETSAILVNCLDEDLESIKYEANVNNIDQSKKLDVQIVRMKKTMEQMQSELVELRSTSKLTTNEEASDRDKNKLSEIKRVLSKTIDMLKNKEKILLKQKSDFDQILDAKEQRNVLLETRVDKLKDEFARSREYANVEKLQLLEIENNSLNARLELASKKVFIINENMETDKQDNETLAKKENLLLRNNLQLAQRLIEKYKLEQLDIEDKAKNFRPKDDNATENIFSKEIMEKNLALINTLQTDKKVMEEKFKSQGLEFKKIDQKLKFTFAQLEEAQKRKAHSGSAANRQFDIASVRINEATVEIAEKKNEIIKLKQEKLALTVKLTELEKKLSISDKKAA